ncbi:MAG: glycosyltransferase [Bacteroidetes bacterium]|nr:glycosyltransferase [Bacteroidota bacterium]MBU1371235.1 glycosyltransferase [Bacteroidota bacterium]MBU1483812.1 glycosyltransferase [Bacteroidota bacterium]MBU1761266.1 glycosyltransferase [Bacteroidota bacterium]MBU2266774.1 glycosyltransferase [Bacteroidota bacterium]
MKILFAPSNIASMPAITAQAMVALGHEAKCITLSDNLITSKNEHVILLKHHSIRNPFLYGYYKLVYLLTLYKLLKWCDVVHWTWNTALPFSLDLKLIKWMKKPRFIEWVGSDIRIPEVTMAESPFYKEAYSNGYEYSTMENKMSSYRNQNNFAKHGFVPILVPEMQLFLKTGLFEMVHTTQYRIPTAKFDAHYPELQNEKIVIVHSPSAKIAKGSNYILPVVESLKEKYNIEFVLLHNVPRSEVLNAMSKADIFIDQIILGSFAAAAIEAMSFGKPVVAYIMPSVYKKGISKDCPIVNANPSTLKEKLIELIESPKLRRDIGKRSRAYVEKVHDAKLVSQTLLEIYKSSSKLTTITRHI